MNNLQTNLLIQKIKSILFSIGLNEKYIAFEYLTIILAYLIKQNNCSNQIYLTALEIVSEHHFVVKRTIIQSLNKLLKSINFDKINHSLTSNLNKNKTLNIIRILVQHIKEQLKI